MTLAGARPVSCLIALSAVGWTALSGIAALPAFGVHEFHQHPGAPAPAAVVTQLAHWMFMVLAMMGLTALGSAQVTAARSFRHRRHRAVTCFLAGYLLIWMLAGGLAVSIFSLPPFSAHAGSSTVVLACFSIAAAWELTNSKKTVLQSCQLTMPLAPHGWRADKDCYRYGWKIGTRCVANCGFLMFACAAAGHGLMLMVYLMALAWASRKWRIDKRAMAALVLSLGVLYA